MSVEPIEKDVQVEDTRRVIVRFSLDAVHEMLRREAGVPEGVDAEVDLASGEWSETTVIWEVTLNG